jgi:RimJ/RimL family protein N-acetyltransferase
MHFNGIGFKKICEDDLPLLTELKEESWGYTHKTTIASIEDQKRWYLSLDRDVHYPKELVFITNMPNSGKTVRFGLFKIFNIDWISRSADVGWDIFHPYRDRGHGKKLVLAGTRLCFELLNLRRLSCEILETNIASQKCAINAGFLKEGTKIKAVFKKGEYIDSQIFGLLRE